MKIIYVLIISILVLFSIYVIYSHITFDLTLQELKKTVGTRNEAQATNIITDLDKFIEKRIGDFRDLSKIPEIQTALTESNSEFSQIEDLQKVLDARERDIEFDSNVPFISGILNEELSDELQDTIEFYKAEYDYDVVEEIFVTNQYGANVGLGVGTSDYRQDDEAWWQSSKNDGVYIGEIQYREDYQTFVLDLGFSITDDEGNFIGVMRVLVSIEDLLHQFIDDVEILHAAKKDVLLLDEQGRIIFFNGIIYNIDSKPVNYFKSLSHDKGFFDISLDENPKLVSYAKSIGYKNFSGFEWASVIIQDESAVIEEFVDLRNTIFITLIIGVIASIIIGIFSSLSISKPLRQIAKATTKLGKGDFDAHVKKSKIDEVQTIGNAVNKMGESLKKLVETEKKLAEAHIQIKNERLTAIGELAASLAHDLKNPLGTIRSSAEIVKRNTKGDDEEMNKVLERMDRAVFRMSHQIEDVLNFVRMTPLNFEKISLRKLFNIVRESIETPNNITVNLPKNDLQIECDTRKIEIVFINIILNAVQALQNGGTIQVRFFDKNGKAIIEVEDPGPGIADEDLNKIFEPLFTTKQKGTGLGLSTCKNIIEQHKGNISVRNNPTTFIIELPLRSSSTN